MPWIHTQKYVSSKIGTMYIHNLSQSRGRHDDDKRPGQGAPPPRASQRSVHPHPSNTKVYSVIYGSGSVPQRAIFSLHENSNMQRRETGRRNHTDWSALTFLAHGLQHHPTLQYVGGQVPFILSRRVLVINTSRSVHSTNLNQMLLQND